MRAFLDNLANIGIVIVAGCAVVVTIQHTRTSSPTRASDRAMTVSTDVIVGYSVGQSLVGAIDVDFSKHNKTLILGLQEGCEFCEASMPLYERIISERNRLMADTHVVVVAPKRNDHIDVYLKDKGVAPDQIVYIEPNSSLHLKVTPTLLVVDRRGVIVETKAGFLAEGVSDQFVKSVTQS